MYTKSFSSTEMFLFFPMQFQFSYIQKLDSEWRTEFFATNILVHFSGCQNSNIVIISKYFNVTLYQPQVDRINANILF